MKKFGKFMLFATATAAIAGAAYMYVQNKKKQEENDQDDQDFDDFDDLSEKDDSADAKASGNRSYVSLDMENKAQTEEFFNDEEKAEGKEN